MDPLALLGLALLFIGGKPSKKAQQQSAARAAEKAETDGAKLLRRANQKRALEWANDFQQTGVDAPAAVAQALARWAGIESSGDPLALSTAGERGLLQATRTTALTEHAMTVQDWDDLQRPTTPRTRHAQIAYRLANWLWDRARTHVKNPPKDYISAIWYAKMYHQRPVDVRDAGMHGEALPMARELALRWKNDAAKMHRLRAANVVAFGVPDP